ncbi:septum formation family protein [Isoptericola sp. 4D.3]|uniref:Septum formation family protein n=1 Tax=Isoptericola peretonis TaxID=2918523 RepID=A0ABT0J9F5_9MICO|nr:septum formation family protein [Isoptericola sp. 4D.3]
MSAPTPPPTGDSTPDPYAAPDAGSSGAVPGGPQVPPAPPTPYTQDAPYSPQPPYAGQPGYGYAPPRRTDGMSVAALVTGVLGLALIPLGLGIAGVVRTNDPARSGRGMAIAGIVLGALSTIAWTLVILLVAFAASSDEFREGFAEGAEEARAGAGMTLEISDCIAVPEDLTDVRNVEHLDCADPHDAEVVGVRELTEASYPGLAEVETRAEEFCYDAFAEYVGTEYDSSTLSMGYFYPTARSWLIGDRQISCWAEHADLSPLTGSVADSGL